MHMRQPGVIRENLQAFRWPASFGLEIMEWLSLLLWQGESASIRTDGIHFSLKKDPSCHKQ